MRQLEVWEMVINSLSYLGSSTLRDFNIVEMTIPNISSEGITTRMLDAKSCFCFDLITFVDTGNLEFQADSDISVPFDIGRGTEQPAEG